MIFALFIPLTVSAIATFSITPFVIEMAKKRGLVDNPKTRHHPAHTHKGIIPRAGGLAIAFGIVSTALLFQAYSPLLAGILLGSVILTTVGLADDRQDVSPYIRFAMNALVAALVVFAGARIPFITNPLTGGILRLDVPVLSLPILGLSATVQWSDIFAFLWIVWTMNIVGWSAGIDGQMPGFVAISALVLGILSLRYSFADPNQWWVTVLAMIVCGAFLGFLPWNYYPQKIMPGYGGKTLAGYFLALLGILSYGKLGTALLVLGVPMIDAAYTLLRRLAGKRSPVLADRGHLHHRLLDLGWGKRRVALFYWGVSAILGLVALTVNSKTKLFAFFFVSVAVTMLLVWLNFFTQFSKQPDPDSG